MKAVISRKVRIGYRLESFPRVECSFNLSMRLSEVVEQLEVEKIQVE